MEKMRKSEGLTVFDMIDKAVELGFSSVEFTDIYAEEKQDKISLAKEVAAYATAKSIRISAYTIGADFLLRNGNDEYERLKKELAVAEALGVKKMRHDICRGFPSEQKVSRGFDDALKIVVPWIVKVTEYAESLGIKTMFENHGFFCQDSDRIEKLINAVASDNFGFLADIGNFACADEDSAIALGKLAPYTVHVHVKDFFLRNGMLPDPGDGWFRSRAGNYLRGTIVGHGNIPVKQCLEILKNSGYNEDYSLEFEGIEDNYFALKTGLDNIKRYLNIKK